MKLSTKLLALAATTFLLTVTYTRAQCLGDSDGEPLPENEKPRNFLYRGEQDFSFAVLDAINQATPNENVFYSPYSTYHAFLLAYFGAKNKTEEELYRGLRLEWARNKQEVMTSYFFEIKKRDRRMLSNTNFDNIFRAADKMFVAKHVELRDCIKNQFLREFEEMDFAEDYETQRREINAWIERVTDNEIKEMLSPGDVTKDTSLILANAAYFKGTWMYKFEKSDTKKEVFHIANDNRTFVDMMSQKGVFKLSLNDQLVAHVLELPYAGGNMSMVIILPPSNSADLTKTLSLLNAESLQKALNEAIPREIEIKVPKFSFEKTINLVPIMSRVGIKDVFLPSANLTGFTEKAVLQLGDAKHKAKIQVDEQGSTAAAATVLFTFRSARPVEPTRFICDHPFIFVIYDKIFDVILFAGIYRDPEQ